MDMTPRVDVRIGELVLDGVEPGDPRVADAVARAVHDALPARARRVEPAAIGDAVARQVAGGER